MKDCGIESYKKDRMKAFRTFDFYSGKGVEWTGYVVMVESMNDDDWLQKYHHSTAIYVKMDPDDKEPNSPSLGLTFSQHE